MSEEQEVDRSILSRCAKFHSQVHHRQVVSLLRSCMLVRVQPWEPSSEGCAKQRIHPPHIGAITQLGRVPVLQAGCWEFESPWLHQFKQRSSVMINKQRKSKARNPFHDHPLMRKGGVHEKPNKTKRANEKQKLKREWCSLITLIQCYLTTPLTSGL